MFTVCLRSCNNIDWKSLNNKFITKIIFWWCLKRYYSMILIRCYYLVSFKHMDNFYTFFDKRNRVKFWVSFNSGFSSGWWWWCSLWNKFVIFFSHTLGKQLQPRFSLWKLSSFFKFRSIHINQKNWKERSKKDWN